MARFFKIIRIVWVTFGVLFLAWMLDSFRARGFDPAILKSDAAVTVSDAGRYIHFQPNANPQPTGFLFFPGALVEPEAYAPMAQALAGQGFHTFLIKLPLGTAPLARHQAGLMQLALDIQHANPAILGWVAGGHSRGGAIAARFAHRYGSTLDGLVLIATSHPKDAAFDLSDRDLTVTKVYGTHDGLAGPAEVEANAAYLPAATHWVRVEGGNHAQFGYYGRQLGDHSAAISRSQQQAALLDAILWTLKAGQATTGLPGG